MTQSMLRKAVAALAVLASAVLGTAAAKELGSAQQHAGIAGLSSSTEPFSPIL